MAVRRTKGESYWPIRNMGVHFVRAQQHQVIAVMPRVCGVSSTPRLFDSIAGASGILDHPHARVMTTCELPGFYPSPSSLAKVPFTARAQPASFRSLVAALIAGLKRCSKRQLSANFTGSG